MAGWGAVALRQLRGVDSDRGDRGPSHADYPVTNQVQTLDPPAAAALPRSGTSTPKDHRAAAELRPRAIGQERHVDRQPARLASGS
jgi:hypothetical protein